jgi:pimeloyl-ACP methyl ester carboxylesterase
VSAGPYKRSLESDAHNSSSVVAPPCHAGRGGTYRINEDDRFNGELNSFSDRTIDVPALYLGGDREWAVYQSPGAFEAMHLACRRLLGVHLVRSAGHSIAEEQPEEVNRLLIGFMRRLSAA